MAAASWEIVAATPCRGDMLGPHIRVYKYENHTIKQEARLFVDIAGQILFQSKWTTSTWHGSFREDPTHGMLILRFHYSGDGVQKSAVVSKVGSNKWEGQNGESPGGGGPILLLCIGFLSSSPHIIQAIMVMYHVLRCP